jgi:hypothetical protein
MKVYVDELPKSCRECFCNVEDTWCALSDGEMGDICEEYDNKTRHKKCPLKTLADYTKQVQNDIFDKVNSEYAKRLSVFMGTKISVSTAITKLDEVLDQIQGESK